MDRKNFLNYFSSLFGIGVSTGFAISSFEGIRRTNQFFSEDIVYYNKKSHVVSDDEIKQLGSIDDDVTPVSSVKPISDAKKKTFVFDRDNILLGDLNCELLGVSHTLNNFNAHIPELSKLIQNSKFVVLESMHTDYSKSGGYFGQIARLCQKYDKSIVTIDNLSNEAIISESSLGVLGGLVAAAGITKSSFSSSRRDFLKGLGLASLGWYFSVGSLFQNSNGFIPENLMFSHTVDHRNVEITSRMNNLSSLIKNSDLNNLSGNYVLVNFGAAHTRGIQYYAKHPRELAIKKTFYDTNYGLIDDNNIKEFFRQDDHWVYRILNKK